ncbi:MAG TPA: hypothetical protein ENI87_13705 [bacterium]|nr:hypothetical protein [bacterium]
MTTFAPGVDVSAAAHGPRLLRNRSWDRLFVAGGAWLVPLPILAFYLFRALGAGVSAAEDLVTLLVMVPLGGPHVFATYTRTYLNPAFRRQDPLMFVLGLLVPVVVIGAAVSSAFFDVVIMGSPPTRYVLTFFFFWAGIHIVHQHCYVVSGYVDRGNRRRWGWIDYAVILLAMYPVSFFRMSMVDKADLSMRTANPDALATRIVTAVTGDPAFADEYIFRIGRVAPILPDFLMHPAMWMTITALFVVALSIWIVKSVRERRRGTLLGYRFRLVLAMAVFGSLVPLMPNLDSAFQGLNAWHSFQYLGLAWLMNRRSAERGEIQSALFERTMREGAHWRFYRTALFATLGAIAVLLGAAWLIAATSNGEFVMFGHDAPPVDANGRELYRPGAVLLAYYLLGFSLLLVHYLHDGFFFCRRRYLRTEPG